MMAMTTSNSTRVNPNVLEAGRSPAAAEAGFVSGRGEQATPPDETKEEQGQGKTAGRM
jgi:hypothetical protein